MVNKGKAAGALYVWQEGIEGPGNFDNPHYSFADIENSIERHLEDDTRDFLQESYISRVATHNDSQQYHLTDKGKEVAHAVYKHVWDRYNGELDTLIDWEDEETVEDLLT